MQSFQRTRLSVAVAAVSMAAAMHSHAAFEEVTVDNPFASITSADQQGRPSLVMMDLDADGDLDAVVFHYGGQTDGFPFNSGGTSVWENTGGATEAQFTHVVDQTDGYGYGYASGDNITVNPFASEYQTYYGHPVTAFDLDDDGDQDFFGGQKQVFSSNRLTFGRVASDQSGVVTGVEQLDFFNYAGSSGVNPFYGSDLAPTAAYGGYAASFAAGDLDDDTDVDFIVADHDVLRYFRNDGPNLNGVFQFTEMAGTDSPFYGTLSMQGFPLEELTAAYQGAPVTLYDVDGDDDLDLVLGSSAPGVLRLLRNVGSNVVPQFEEVITDKPVDVITKGWAAATFADMDADGNGDLIVVEIDANTEGTPQSIRLFKNTAGSASSGGGGSSGALTGFATLLLAGFGLLRRRARRR